ncbi:histidine kinase [Streptomyces sp. GZWMJZ-114]|uniref:histidine kinase n=1 Tax=Streptomyces sp. GZWMJZ-114 TaxID=2494734 RepID=UPI0010109C6F|nr:histidine kinase [Streptomyces sp. GZWMJZ-114]
MRKDVWSAWPSREALSRESRRRVESEARTAATRGVRVTLLGFLLWVSHQLNPDAGPARVIGGLVLLGLAIVALRRFFRVTREQHLGAAVPCMAALLLAGAGAYGLDWHLVSSVVWCLSAIVALERLPLGWGGAAAFLGLGAYFLTDQDNWIATLVTCGGLVLAGLVMRLDAEARGAAHRLLIEERSSQAARAESAALAERARIAREIHDVLAHSLSAQLVHLEAARIQLEQGADRQQVLERVVAARGMAREGLEETRQALSALRGDMAPVAEALAELAAREGTVLRVEGEARPVAAEAGQTLRRVAQEALTNVRKHAPGARPRLRLVYGPEAIELEVRNGPGRQPWGERVVWGECAERGEGFVGGGHGQRGSGAEAGERGGGAGAAGRGERRGGGGEEGERGDGSGEAAGRGERAGRFGEPEHGEEAARAEGGTDGAGPVESESGRGPVEREPGVGPEDAVDRGAAVGAEAISGPDLAASGSGYGVRGMRERAELLGGTLSAGPPEDGEEGFVVRLRVPA